MSSFRENACQRFNFYIWIHVYLSSRIGEIVYFTKYGSVVTGFIKSIKMEFTNEVQNIAVVEHVNSATVYEKNLSIFLSISRNRQCHGFGAQHLCTAAYPSVRSRGVFRTHDGR
jgi:hypothetical protein